MRSTRQPPHSAHDRPTRDDDHDRAADAWRDPDPPRDTGGRPGRGRAQAGACDPTAPTDHADAARNGRAGDPVWSRRADGPDAGRPDPAAPAFRGSGPRATAYRHDRQGTPGHDAHRADGLHDAGSSGDGSRADGPRAASSRGSAVRATRGDPVLVAAPHPDAVQADPLHADAVLGHGVLGAGWIDGDLAALDVAIHPAAVLRTGPGVATGPGAVMAAALADLGRYRTLAYFAENTLASTTTPADICPRALAAMDMDQPPADGAILSLRGSLTGRLSPGSGDGAARDIRERVMADLWCGHGQVLDGWILRDSGGALAQARGPHPADWARARLRAAGGPDRMPPPLTPDTDPDGPYVARSPRSRRCERGETLADRLRRIMDGDLATLDRGSDPACAHVLPGGVTGLGAAPARAFWAGLRAALPSAAFRIEHRHGAARPFEAPQAAVRWSLYGRHDGPGRFGAPTGCFLHVAGMTQVEFGPRGVRRDWTVIDDCAVWTQIVMATGQA